MPKEWLLNGFLGLERPENGLKVKVKKALEMVLEGLERAKIWQKWQKVRVPIGLM